jgi:hypothetical protein
MHGGNGGAPLRRAQKTFSIAASFRVASRSYFLCLASLMHVKRAILKINDFQQDAVTRRGQGVSLCVRG